MNRLSDAHIELLNQALVDESVIDRFRSKIVKVPGSECLWWTGSISGRGHGRFWVTRDFVMIAHRFAFALAWGLDALLDAEVLAHRCDNPLCQRPNPGHVVASTTVQNRREWAARRHVGAGPLADPRGSRGRAQTLRDLARRHPSLVAEDRLAIEARYGCQDTLW